MVTRESVCADEMTTLLAAEASPVRAWESLAERGRFLQAIIDAEPDCVKVVDADGIVLDMNLAGLRMIEADSREQVIGQSAYHSIAPEFHADFRALSRAVFRGESRMLEFEIVGLKGGRRRLEMHAVPLRGQGGEIVAQLAVTRDVTEQRRAEEALRASEERYRDLFENANDLVYTHDLDGNFTSLNKAGERVTGYTRDEALRMNIAQIVVPEQLTRAREMMARKLDGAPPTVYALDITTKGGRRVPLELSTRLIYRGGAAVGVQGIGRDITERVRMEEALRESEARYRRIITQAPDIIYRTDAAGRFIFVNPTAVRLMRCASESELIGQHYLSLVRPDYREAATKFYGRQFDERLPDTYFEFPALAGDGAEVWFGQNVQLLTDGDRVAGFQAVARDITERKRAEEALKESEEKFRSFVETTSEWIWAMDRDGRMTYNNPAIEAILGYHPGELLGQNTLAFMHEEDRAAVEQLLPTLAAEKRGWSNLVCRWRHRDGTVRWLESSATPILDAEGTLVGYRGTDRDITERQRAEEALHESYNLLNAVTEGTTDAIFVKDLEGRYLMMNAAGARLLGRPAREIVGKSDAELYPPEVARQFVEDDRKVLATREAQSFEGQITLDGNTHTYLVTKGVHCNHQGEVIGLIGISCDITERKQAEQAVTEANRRAIVEYEHLLGKISSLAQGLGTARDLTTAFRAVRDFAISSAPCDVLLVSLYDADHQTRAVSYCWADGEEIDVAHLPTLPVSESGFVGRAIKTQTISLTGDYQKEIEGRATVFVETRRKECEANSALVAPMTLKGVTVGVVEVLSYERSAFHGEHRTAMQMAANLAAIAIENVRLFERERDQQEQLRQSQKMEAVGKLAGGVAHDFNNLLTAITGYSALCLRRLKRDDPIRRHLEEIAKAGDRAAGLTRQLLAFSRKQVLQPKVLNLNTIVADISNMLQRLIGEDITLFVRPDPGLGRIKADPSQLEQVLVNLAVNARDAMPTGGKLTIETTDVYLDAEYAARHVAVAPGHYVMLAVSDTGCGMDEETRARVFEPFFTTKEVGKGTGLGLSTVYGIIKQSGGNIWVYSELNIGTTFKIYLPQVREGVGEPGRDLHRSEAPDGHETVLLVEDEEMVRQMTTEVLRESGYQVLTARHGREALQVAAEYRGTIHLLLSDVVMPQMSGRELVEHLAPQRPAMRVLYMSGYTDDAIVHHGVLDPGTEFIEKPFTPDQIIRKVRAVLDAAAQN